MNHSQLLNVPTHVIFLYIKKKKKKKTLEIYQGERQN